MKRDRGNRLGDWVVGYFPGRADDTRLKEVEKELQLPV